MAETVSWDGLRELAEFRAEKGCAISFYFDLDPKTTPTAGDAATRVSSLLTEGERHAETNNRGLTHDQRVALKKDFARIRDYFADEFQRDGAHGVAVFSAGMDNVWRPRALIESVADKLPDLARFFGIELTQSHRALPDAEATANLLLWFANDLPAKEGATLEATQGPAVFSALTAPSGPPAWKTIPSWDLVGTIDNAIPSSIQLFMANRAHAHITEVKAGHLSMISQPAAVTKVIEEAAQSVASR